MHLPNSLLRAWPTDPTLNPGIVLGGQMPSMVNSAMGGLSVSEESHLLDFYLHWPRMKLDVLLLVPSFAEHVTINSADDEMF